MLVFGHVAWLRTDIDANDCGDNPKAPLSWDGSRQLTVTRDLGVISKANVQRLKVHSHVDANAWSS